MEVFRLRVNGYGDRQIAYDLARAWGETERTIRRYLQDVRSEAAERAKERQQSGEADQELQRAIDQIEDNYANLSALASDEETERRDRINARKTMMNLIRVRTELQGLVVRKVEIAGAGGGPVAVAATVDADVKLSPVDEARRALATRLAKSMGAKK